MTEKYGDAAEDKEEKEKKETGDEPVEENDEGW